MEKTFDEIKEFVRFKTNFKEQFDNSRYYYTEENNENGFYLLFYITDNESNILEEIIVNKSELSTYYQI